MGSFNSVNINILFNNIYIHYKNINTRTNPKYIKYFSKKTYNILLDKYISIITDKKLYIYKKYNNILTEDEQNMKLNIWIKQLNHKLKQFYGNNNSIEILYYIKLENLLTINDLFFDYKNLNQNKKIELT